ncbi:MAG TPA: SUMF1/EgtB/PvdO family nonheme iron enzyme, partial [Polyangia bacterium]
MSSRVAIRRTAGTIDLVGIVVWLLLVGAHGAVAKSGLPVGILEGMVDVPGGRFSMGSTDADASENEKPVHAVTVAVFRLDKTEVTVKAYAECVR